MTKSTSTIMADKSAKDINIIKENIMAITFTTKDTAKSILAHLNLLRSDNGKHALASRKTKKQMLVMINDEIADKSIDQDQKNDSQIIDKKDIARRAMRMTFIKADPIPETPAAPKDLFAGMSQDQIDALAPRDLFKDLGIVSMKSSRKAIFAALNIIRIKNGKRALTAIASTKTQFLAMIDMEQAALDAK